MPDAVGIMATGIRDPLPEWVTIAGLMLDFGYTEREIMEEISPAMIERMAVLAQARAAAERAKNGSAGGSMGKPGPVRKGGRR